MDIMVVIWQEEAGGSRRGGTDQTPILHSETEIDYAEWIGGVKRAIPLSRPRGN